MMRRLHREAESLRAALQQAEVFYQHALAEVDILTQAAEAEQFGRLSTENEEPENQVEVAITYYEGKAARAGNKNPMQIADISLSSRYIGIFTTCLALNSELGPLVG
ncbi:hypothetical protein CF327_g2089 [Tilletia walkeri]|nr:hypothetical protein CF327_g2089 [Tilletia walkeri]